MALCLFVYNIYEDYNSRIMAENVNSSLQDAILDNRDNFLKNGKMSEEVIDGKSYIGILEIPSLNINLPVMSSWSYENLKISPNLYTGSYFTDDLVICAHNYRSHFGKLKKLDMNSKINFITVEGDIYSYRVTNARVLNDTAIEDMIVNSSKDSSKEDWDLSLFTCTVDGRARFTIRAVKEN